MLEALVALMDTTGELSSFRGRRVGKIQEQTTVCLLPMSLFDGIHVRAADSAGKLGKTSRSRLLMETTHCIKLCSREGRARHIDEDEPRIQIEARVRL